ncbi:MULTISPECIES: methylenetetrahydrofolate reductase [Agrobacterium]|uniref:methylenetetrahydrofolate reductase n=1 Tax=Agrobacterium TaxID=357 RepID=UPI0022FFCBE3|nr:MULTISPECIES: methylenetetrahydrofolate reductase [Agrobacterium]MDA5638197.1 methylenetetrahydrofolate reductase [Agrobacterium sp. ST15.13.013]MDA6998096.1 methylenetetrahydrofolate reductase [Agrobacterium salinitolerans]
MGWSSFWENQASVEHTVTAGDIVSGWSIEVMPRTAAKIGNFRDILPEGTRVYIAHIEGTPIADMISTAKRLHHEGFPVIPHIPARGIGGKSDLEEWLKRYRGEAGVTQALLLGGGQKEAIGSFSSSIDMIETGLFDEMGFTHLHLAGHPEGNRDIDPDGSSRAVDQALLWKQNFADRTGARLALTTQFAFDADVVTEWATRIRAMGVTIPIHVGVAGPTKLQTLIKFAVACGVGPSLKVLQKRALDLSRLFVPYEPTDVIAGLVAHKAAHPDSLIEQVHIFPLGGITPAAEWMKKHTSSRTFAHVA